MTARKPTIWLINDYKLGADSWWFKQGIPATLKFPGIFRADSKRRQDTIRKSAKRKHCR